MMGQNNATLGGNLSGQTHPMSVANNTPMMTMHS